MASSTTNYAPTPLFIEMCSKFFSDTSTYNALDKNGNDVTQRFYNAHISEYRSSNYEALMDAFIAELSAFRWKSEDSTTTASAGDSSRIIYNRTVTDDFYGVATSTHMSNKTADFVYTISGDYAVSDGSNQIISYGEAELNIDFSDPGALFSIESTNIKTRASTNTAKTKVDFSASFKVNLSYSEKYTGITLWTDTSGPFSNKVSGSV